MFLRKMKINGENLYVCSMLLNDELPSIHKKKLLLKLLNQNHITHI